MAGVGLTGADRGGLTWDLTKLLRVDFEFEGGDRTPGGWKGRRWPRQHESNNAILSSKQRIGRRGEVNNRASSKQIPLKDNLTVPNIRILRDDA